MNKAGYFLVAAVILLLAGAGLPSASITTFLVPGISGDRLAAVLDGALLLRVLLVIDALLLFSIVVNLVRRRRDDMPVWQPLWQPVRDTSILCDDFPHYDLAVYALLLLALVLRLISLNGDLWIDEVLTLVNFVRQPLGYIITDYSSDNQHILFSLLSRISVSLFGEQPWAVRLPALLFGMASLWATIQLAALVYGRRVAIYSGLLLALSYHHIWFSQNARGYSILLFGTVFSTLLLLRGLQTGQWRYWTGYALVIALSAWAHITAVFVSVAHALVVLLLLVQACSLKQMRWRPLAGFFLAALFTLHFYALVLPQMLAFFSQPGAGTGVLQTEWRSPLWLINETFRSLGIGTAFGWSGLIGVAVSGLLALYWYARRDHVFVLLAILPGLLLGMTMFALGRNLWPRMFFNEAGFIVIFLVVALLAAGDFVSRKLLKHAGEILPATPVLLLALVFASALPGLYRYPKQDFTSARDYVRAHAVPADRVLGLHVAGRIYHQYYANEWPDIESLEEFRRQQSRRGYTWVLYTLPRHLQDAMPELMRELESRYEIVKVFPGTLGDGEIIVCRSLQQGIGRGS